jgi:hypothetical protein
MKSVNRHSRTPSVASTSDILAPPVMTPSSPALAPTIPVAKKLQRQSAGPRLTQVKANIGLPRVRTSSITQQKEQQSNHQQKVTFATTTMSIPSGKETKTPIISTTTKPTSISTRPTHIPLPPSSQQTTPTSANSAGSDKKSLLKPPSQRGPGSTLRLRSMLAKRGQQLPTPTVPKTP